MNLERRLSPERKDFTRWGHYKAELCCDNEYVKSLNAGLARVESPLRFYVIYNNTEGEIVTKGLFSELKLKDFYRKMVWDFKNKEYKYPNYHEVSYLDNTAEICFSDLVPQVDIRRLYGQTLSLIYKTSSYSCYTVKLGLINKFWSATMRDLPIFIDIKEPDGNNMVWFDVRMPLTSSELQQRVYNRAGLVNL